MRQSFLYSSIASLIAGVSAHTWVEQLMNVDSNGSYYGAPGYIRSYVPRNAPGFSDTEMTWLSPQNPVGGSRTRIDSSDVLCSPNQRQPVNNAAYPSLKTTAGNTIAMRYLENGHVTQPLNQLGKPAAGGLVYIYATTNPKVGETLTNVLSWGTNGTLAEGRLLNINPFDDGRCYQVSGATISLQRQAETPNPIQGQPGVNHELWCQNNVQVPEDATDTLTMYWVWQWPTQPGVDPGLPSGKDEIYTSCMDINLVQSSTALKNAVGGLSLGSFEDTTPALKDFKQRLDNTTFPVNPAIYYNPGNLTGSTQPSPSSGQTTAPASQASSSAGAGRPGHSGKPGQFAPQSSTTLQTVTSAPAAAAPAQATSQPGVVLVTETSTDFATVTVYENPPTGGPNRRSAKFRR